MDKSILEVVHCSVKGLYDAGIVNATTMHEFDALCLPTIKDFSPQAIKRLRLKEKVSQAVFAKYLNTSPSTIKHWEQGQKHPRGTALKILNLVANKGLGVLV